MEILHDLYNVVSITKFLQHQEALLTLGASWCAVMACQV